MTLDEIEMGLARMGNKTSLTLEEEAWLDRADTYLAKLKSRRAQRFRRQIKPIRALVSPPPPIYTWPNDVAEALTNLDVVIYIDKSGSMADDNALQRAIDWVVKVRGSNNRVYLYNHRGIDLQIANVKPDGGDGTIYALNHAFQMRRPALLITDGMTPPANPNLRVNWAVCLTRPDLFWVGGGRHPAKVYRMPATPMFDADAVQRAVDRTAKAARAAVEGRDTPMGPTPQGVSDSLVMNVGSSPAITSDDPELLRSYAEQLAEALHRSRKPGRPIGDFDRYAFELAEQLLDAKKEREAKDKRKRYWDAVSDLLSLEREGWFNVLDRRLFQGERPADISSHERTVQRVREAAMTILEILKEDE